MKKLTISLLLIICATCMGFVPAKAQNNSIGVALKASTMGLGGDVVYRFHEKMTARLGFDALGYSYKIDEFEQQDIKFSADASLKSGSITALYDYYLAKSVYVSVGAGLNNFAINAKGAAKSGLPYGDITIPAEKVGSFDIAIKPSMRISPYLGLGFGKTLGQKLGFGFEIGSYYMGGPDLTINTTGLISPTSNPDLGQEVLLEKQLSQYYLYPTIKFSLSYNIFSF